MASEAVPRLMPHDLAAEDPVQQTAPRMPTRKPPASTRIWRQGANGMSDTEA